MLQTFKLSVIVEDHNGNGIEAINPQSNTELETILENLHNRHLIVEQEWLHVVTLKLAKPSLIEQRLNNLPEEAFEEPAEEYPVVIEEEINIIEEEVEPDAAVSESEETW